MPVSVHTKYKSISPGEIPVSDFFAFMLSSIAPRPIALVSSMDEEGRPNLAPFSFFNAFGANPPIMIFSPSRRGRDNTTKHTFENVKLVPEVVINVVTYDMVQQTSLSSSDFPEGINEFEKSGFTMLESSVVKPFRVKESPVQYECKILNVIETGTEGSAGNLVICEVLKIHVAEGMLLNDGKIDLHKIDLVGRMGGDLYVRASGQALFEVQKPLTKPGIGVDSLPYEVKLSSILSGNDLGQLGNLKDFPTIEELAYFKDSPAYKELIQDEEDVDMLKIKAQHLAQTLISNQRSKEALTLLLLTHS